MRHFPKEKIFKNFKFFFKKNVLRFLSLRYSADFRRSRLVFLFVRQTTDLIVYVPLFTDFTRSRVLVSTVLTRFTVNPAVRVRVLAFFVQFFSALCDYFSVFFAFKGSHLQVFFRKLKTIFCLQRALPSIYLIFCNKLGFSKDPKGPAFTGLKTAF